MNSNKLGTVFLLLLMVFTLAIGLGCEKENEKPNGKDGDIVEKEPENPVPDKPKEEAKKPVKLLKRNGVEWKENTKIKSKRGDQKYTVVWGDTLSLIARTWNVNCYKLARYNNIKNIDRIEVGQVIYNYTYKG